MTPEIDLAETKNCYCLAARRSARAITRLYEDKLRPHGLRATQFTILAALCLMGPTPLGELASRLGLERTTLTRSAALLERNTWIDTIGSEDARERRLRVTPEGRQKIEEAFAAWKEAQELVAQQVGSQHALAPTLRPPEGPSA
ncbi:MAG TPA: MarR family transcriptional regulator [Trueperaceae bacterium]